MSSGPENGGNDGERLRLVNRLSASRSPYVSPFRSLWVSSIAHRDPQAYSIGTRSYEQSSFVAGMG